MAIKMCNHKTYCILPPIVIISLCARVESSSSFGRISESGEFASNASKLAFKYLITHLNSIVAEKLLNTIKRFVKSLLLSLLTKDNGSELGSLKMADATYLV